jgi:hypothetical protein
LPIPADTVLESNVPAKTAVSALTDCGLSLPLAKPAGKTKNLLGKQQASESGGLPVAGREGEPSPALSGRDGGLGAGRSEPAAVVP